MFNNHKEPKGEGVKMQNCVICGASWSSDKSASVCPFCGADLNSSRTADSIERAFAMIMKDQGKEVFLDGNRLIGLIGDYAPSLTHERKLIKLAIEIGAYEAIYKAPISERKEVLNRYKWYLINNYYINEEWARKVLMWCIIAIADDGYECLLQDDNLSKAGINGNTDSYNKDSKEQLEPVILIEDGILKKYSGNAENVVFPPTIHTIDARAFYQNTTLKEVVLPDSVK